MPYSEPERRYPPTPYAPRSAATQAYRYRWDLGQRHYATIGLAGVIRFCDGLRRLTPEWRGYVDGVRAAWEREQKHRAAEHETRQRMHAAEREQWRREGQAERPY